MYTQPSSPSILKMAGVSLLFLIPLIYGIIAMNTGDLLWISPVFNAQPKTILIHCYGEDITLEPGTQHFVQVTDLVNSALSGRKRWDSLSLSDVTYQDYQNDPKMMVLDLFYKETVRVHSRYKFFSHVNELIIPLEGRHAETKAIFGRWLDNPAAGSFHVETTAPLVQYLTSQGLCSQP